MIELLKKRKFSVLFSTAMVITSICCLYIDYSSMEMVFLFQRSGALLILAGVALQYSRISSTWNSHITIPNSVRDPDEQRVKREIYGVSDIETESLDLAVKTHEIVTTKSLQETIAVLLIIIGTAVSAYGDLPFKQ